MQVCKVPRLVEKNIRADHLPPEDPELCMIEAPVLTTGTHGQVWVHSDLQLSDPQQAREVLTAAVDDLLELDLNLDAVWCLGDALCGADEASLEEVARTSIEQLDRLDVPICYVMGNHEMDMRRVGENRYPLYERVCQYPRWHTMDNLEDLFFARIFFGTLVIFMGDHAAADRRWWTTHGTVKGDAEAYPHTREVYAGLQQAIADHPGPVVTASHYAYPGGQRPSELMRHLLPLPDNVRLHTYGHAHIGDHVFNKERPYQRDNPIDGQPLRQFNISALETRRSAGSHSAILAFGPEGPTTLRIRCHLERCWIEMLELTPQALS